MYVKHYLAFMRLLGPIQPVHFMAVARKLHTNLWPPVVILTIYLQWWRLVRQWVHHHHYLHSAKHLCVTCTGNLNFKVLMKPAINYFEARDAFLSNSHQHQMSYECIWCDHVIKLLYGSVVFKQDKTFNPDGHRWKIYQPYGWHNLQPAPYAILSLILCGCKSGHKRMFSCVK